VGHGLFRATHRTTLLDGAARQADILASLDRLATQPKRDDSVVFLSSGYGNEFATMISGREEKVRSIGRPSDFYLFPFDTNGSHLTSSTISGHEIRAALRRIRARNQLIILDSCHSAAAFENGAAVFVEPDSAIEDLFGENILFLGADTGGHYDGRLGSSACKARPAADKGEND
jgi:uncharacterized caspase-like protein